MYSNKNTQYALRSINRLLKQYNKRYNLGYKNLTSKSISQANRNTEFIESTQKN